MPAPALNLAGAGDNNRVGLEARWLREAGV
jgi:hypothetical protein